MDMRMALCVPAALTFATALAAQNEIPPDQSHIAEIGACGGRLAAIGKDTLTLKHDHGSCVLHFNSETTFWRGEDSHDPGILRIGDTVFARYTVGYPGGELNTDSVEANVAKAEGPIVDLKPDRIVVKDTRPARRVTILVDARTRLYPADGRLEKGTEVLATGLDLGHKKFRATQIIVEEPLLISPAK